MFNEKQLVKLLEDKNYTFIKGVRFRPSDKNFLIYVLQEKISSKAGGGFTSHRQLNQLKNTLRREYEIECDIIIIENEQGKDIEARLFKMLVNKYKNKLTSFFTSTSSQNDIDGFIEVDDSEKFPTLINLLRLIKIKQPVSTDELFNKLSEEYTVINKKWLKNKLDLLRKKGLIIRQQDRKYVLTSNALKTIPSGARRSSSDIERALALGKRKW